jgi:hypothetical protein
MIAGYSDFSWPWDRLSWKSYLLRFPYICTLPKSEVVSSCMSIWRQGGLESWVGLKIRLRNFELDWIFTLMCASLSAPSWCPTCPPWSTYSFIITIKLLGSNLFSRSLVEEYKNEFIWWFSHCTHDFLIGPCISMERVIVSNIVMSTSILSSLPQNMTTSARLTRLVR